MKTKTKPETQTETESARVPPRKPPTRVGTAMFEDDKDVENFMTKFFYGSLLLGLLGILLLCATAVIIAIIIF